MPSGPVLRGSVALLRPWARADVPALLSLADDASVARYLGSTFPSPYLRSDASEWIDYNLGFARQLNFAIEVSGELAGGIGILPGDQIWTGSGMTGYWLGASFWGRGIAADAVRTMTRHGFDELGLRRIWAGVMAPNAPSMRVLEKAGYVREARLRASVIDRLGMVHDEVIYARLATDG